MANFSHISSSGHNSFSGDQDEEPSRLPSFAEVFHDVIPGISKPRCTPIIQKKKKSRGKPDAISLLLGQSDQNHEEMSINTGRWTPEEHKQFLEAVMLYGRQWKKMTGLIKTRSLNQIRAHAQKVFQKVDCRAEQRKLNKSSSGSSNNTGNFVAQDEMTCNQGSDLEDENESHDDSEESTDINLQRQAPYLDNNSSSDDSSQSPEPEPIQELIIQEQCNVNQIPTGMPPPQQTLSALDLIISSRQKLYEEYLQKQETLQAEQARLRHRLEELLSSTTIINADQRNTQALEIQCKDLHLVDQSNLLNEQFQQQYDHYSTMLDFYQKNPKNVTIPSNPTVSNNSSYSE